MPDTLRLAGTLLEGLRDLVFAPVCLACRGVLPRGARPPLVCGACWSRCRGPSPPHCARCGRTVGPGAARGRACSACRELPATLRIVRSAFVHDGPARQLVHALKFGGWPRLAEPMAARMAMVDLPADVRDEARIVVPVPLAPARERERGYNQAELLARELCRRRGMICDVGALRRVRTTARQSGLHGRERRGNVATAFAVPDEARRRLSGEHVLLVDDVWTTGATALACLEALVDGGARIVSVITFARAHDPGDRAAPGL